MKIRSFVCVRFIEVRLGSSSFSTSYLQGRMKAREKERKQKAIIALSSLVFIGIYLLPGFDRRYGWSSIPVAVVIAAPTTYRSIQLKGHFVEAAPPEPGDAEWVQRHRDLYAAATALVGQAPHASRNLGKKEVLRMRFSVEDAFDQTPGPQAGARL